MEAGTLLGGRYVLEGTLGKGAFAMVYAVRHRLLGTAHALKLLHSGGSDGERQKMLEEGRLQASVHHPNVVRVTDVLELPEGVGLVMDRVEGESLRALLDRAALGSREVARIAEALFAGVEAAHSVGLLHRDLKPDNVLVGPDGSPRISDFGIALGPGTERLGPAMGTPGYMAPEAYQSGNRIDVRADIFSLGAILYDLITGRPAFAVDLPWREHQQKAGGADFVRPVGCPPAWAAAVVAALAPAASARPATVAALRSLWQGGPAQASTATLRLEDEGISEVPHQLPAERDPFFGREEDLLRLEKQVGDGARLVTVTGIGGAGKTRFISHYGWRTLSQWPGGVWFCDLSEVQSLDGIFATVGRSLDVPLGVEPGRQLGHALAARGRCLLLLDNFEQVSTFALQSIGFWLDRAPELVVLVSSRERLGLPGEQLLPLAALTEAGAVALFGARARAVRGDFVEEEGDVILRLVRALDLLPLAIELAAARVRLLSPSAILAKMNHRFKLLTSTGGRPGRHATLRGMLDWSWELLTGQEQQALAQLSVFSGGFSIDAADVVVEVGEGWVLDLLQSLADKSLVRPGERMEMLGCVQEYAAERLDQRGERESTERRHGQFFARYGEEAAVARLEERGGHHHRVARVPELGNLHVAWERAVGRGDGEVAAATALAAWSILELKGPFPVGISMLEACLDLRLARRSRLRVLAAAGRARQLAGQLWEGRRHLEAGIGEVEEHRDLEGILRGSLAVLDANAGQLEAARRNYLAALAIHREVGSRRYEGLVLGNLGLLCHQQGRIEEFASYLQTALPIHREVGNRRSESNVLGNMAVLYMDQGRMEEARQGFEAAIAIAREVGDRRAEGNLLGNLGNLNHNLENYVEAEAQYRESLTRHRQMGNRRYEAIFLGNLGALLADTGRVEEALATDQQALAIHREVGNRRFEGMVLGNLSELLARMGAVEEGRDCLIRGEALLREVEDRLALGKVLCGRATLEAGAGNWALALRAAQEAEQIALALDLGPTSQLRKLLAELDPKLIEART